MAQLTAQVFITRTFTGFSIAAGTGGAGGAGGGSSAVDGLNTGTIDMANFNGCVWIASVVQGGTGGAVSFSIRASSAAIVANTSGGQGTAISNTTSTIAAGSSATFETFVVDLYKPRQYTTPALGGRFLSGQISVASSCSWVGPTYTIQYEPRATAVSSAGSTLTSIPQSTGSSTASPFITGGVLRAVSPST